MIFVYHVHLHTKRKKNDAKLHSLVKHFICILDVMLSYEFPCLFANALIQIKQIEGNTHAENEISKHDEASFPF